MVYVVVAYTLVACIVMVYVVVGKIVMAQVPAFLAWEEAEKESEIGSPTELQMLPSTPAE